MKKLLLCCTIMATVYLYAQDFKGIAVYESVSTLKNLESRISKLDPAMQARMKEALSKPVERQFTLYFDKTVSVYEENQKLDIKSAGYGRTTANLVTGKTYRDLKAKVTIEEKEVFGKEFLVTDSLKMREWQLVNETKKIGNYTCYKAAYTIKRPSRTGPENEKATDLLGSLPDEMVVTAWYAPEIPVSHGPDNYWGLPGMILCISTDNMNILCSKLVLNPAEGVDLKVPNKGEKVTKKEFMDIISKKAEEMREMRNTKPRRH
ncbi:GLPGLI family protein [Flavobacterium sp. MFBS3-15]|uniref:GLPGLI family protein n=1 Tax=Flavobacterium sp. MFBS3-15 TaxID=2989816 RepID=UPI002235E976|nr:GLPGLI family protein [Flavobacterium sp. MFBS3-15]MCW4468749.1 GLPGLI family protein [Flavobacterium sp. MFBS3-15]